LGLELRHREHLRSVQRFGQLGLDLAWTMRAEHMRPPHDLTLVHARLRDRIAALEAELADLSPRALARGPLHYAIGEGYRALGGEEDAHALQHLEAAWRLGVRSPDAAYALSATLARHHADRWQTASSALRQRVAALLALGRRAQSASPAYVEAQLALHDGRHDAALRLAEQARRTMPWAHDADRLVGDVHLAISRAADVARPATTDAVRAAAGRAYARAIERGPSDPANRVRLCRLEAQQIESYLQRPHPPGNDHARRVDDHYRRGREACGIALRLRARSADAYAARGYVELAYANYQRWRGDHPPEPYYAAALRDHRRALRIAPSTVRFHIVRFDSAIQYASFAESAGRSPAPGPASRDPRPYLDLAALHGHWAVRRAPDNPRYLLALADAYARRARLAHTDPHDRLRHVRLAHRLYVASRRPGDTPRLRVRRATALFGTWRGVLSHALGDGDALQPGLTFMRQALEGAGAAVADDGWDMWRWNQLYQYEAMAIWGSGGDPRAAFDQAARYLQRAQQLDPMPTEFWYHEVLLREARVDLQWVFSSVDAVWLGQQTARLRALGPRVPGAVMRRDVDRILRRMAAQYEAMHGDAFPVDAPSGAVQLETLDDPGQRTDLALWLGLAAAARGDDDAVRAWRAIVAAAAENASEASAWQRTRLRARLHLLDAALRRDDPAARADHVAAVERIAAARLANSRWLRHDAQMLRLALASKALTPAAPSIVRPSG
ncbi:MAG: hypothetical protein AAF772_20365, partial [Acidobacteriota bacterium]